MNQFEEAMGFLSKALLRRKSYLDEISDDPALAPLVNDDVFKNFAQTMNLKTC